MCSPCSWYPYPPAQVHHGAAPPGLALWCGIVYVGFRCTSHFAWHMFVYRWRTEHGFLYTFLYTFLQPEGTGKWSKVGENLVDAVTTFVKNSAHSTSRTCKPVLKSSASLLWKTTHRDSPSRMMA